MSKENPTLVFARKTVAKRSVLAKLLPATNAKDTYAKAVSPAAKTTKRCRHGRAWPTIYNLADAGFLWCPECGAVRGIKREPGANVYVPYQKRWRVPGKWTPDMDMEMR